MNVYVPRKVVGGNLGKTYQGVIKTAQMFARSKVGKSLADMTKKKILKVGAQAVDRMLSGESPAGAIKTAATALSSQLTPTAKNKLKRSVFGKRKRKKLGGQTLYKLKRNALDTTRFKLNKRLKRLKALDSTRFKLNKRFKGRPRIKAKRRVATKNRKKNQKKSVRYRLSKKFVSRARTRKKVVKRAKKRQKKKSVRRKKRKRTRRSRRIRRAKGRKSKKSLKSRRRVSAKRIKSVFDL
jgi:hypothetical protein